MTEQTDPTTGFGHRLSTPDITKAQIVALLESIVAVAAALGLTLSDSERQALIAMAGAVGAVLMAADAFIRNGRAKAAAMRESLQGARGEFQQARGDFQAAREERKA